MHSILQLLVVDVAITVFTLTAFFNTCTASSLVAVSESSLTRTSTAGLSASSYKYSNKMIQCCTVYRRYMEGGGGRGIRKKEPCYLPLSYLQSWPFHIWVHKKCCNIMLAAHVWSYLIMALMPSATALAQEDGREGFSSTAAPALRNRL